MRAVPFLIVIGGILLASACIDPFGARTEPRFPAPGSPPAQRARGETLVDSITSGIGRKVVNGKREPNVLVAIDGATCRVSERKFRETSYGERAFCAWRPAAGPR